MKKKNFAFTLAEGATHVGTWKVSRQVAFTLAEVLITLGVIGVVAAITMPTLIKNYQKQQMVNQLKKVYSVFGQVIARSEADNGFVGEWDFTLSNTDFAKTYILPYIKLIDDCGVEENSKCRVKGAWLNGNEISVSEDAYSFITTDGVKCNLNLLTTNQGVLTLACDINGNKGPSIAGKDIFYFNLFKGVNRLTFAGAPSDGRINSATLDNNMNDQTHGCNKTATERAGLVCGYAIFLNNWQIPDNYPW